MSRKTIVNGVNCGQYDLAILNTNLVNVLTGAIYPTDIGIVGETIATVSPAGKHKLSAKEVVVGDKLWAVPGFIDGHVHNESSMCTPAHWTEAILPRGTTTVCTDPHEIGNVLGMVGVRYMLEASRGLPLDYYITVPSCVPAVPELETAGAVFTAQEVQEMLTWERTVAIAEAMDYLGLINQRGKITPIVEAGHKASVPIEGHAPGVMDKALQAYLAAIGPRGSDHESFMAEEMVQKVQNGMLVYARTSTFRNGMVAVAEALENVNDARMFGMCTDDVMPNHLLEHGHMDFAIRSLIEQGVDPVRAVQMATINVAQHYGFWGRGAVAPGWTADIVLLSNLEEIDAQYVIANGELVAKEGEMLRPVSEAVEPLVKNTVLIPDLTSRSFVLETPVQEGRVLINAINTAELFTHLTTLELQCERGALVFPLPENVCLGAIVPRHGQGTAPSVVPLVGYPLKRGAIASTISHDSHNLVVIGKNPRDMLTASLELARCGGGLTSVLNGSVLATAELPIAGLMSPNPVPEIAQAVVKFEQSLGDLGLRKEFPLHLLALALPVVPEVRLTDRGLVDAEAQELLPLFP